MAAPNQVDITQLNVQQLSQLSQQLEQEISFFTNSLKSLKMAQQKFNESQECLNSMNEESKDKEVLVPLTGSMYVPGTLSNVTDVLVDVGTGYYVEKSIEGGKKYFKRKVEFITKQIEKIQPILQEKAKMKQAVMEILQLKVQSQMSQQQQQGVART
ncbi:prefoldin subunit 5-like [Tubulanus polymorphus]|uniref:prefoldin subunit 5-like n=1 Tax=Tubulanus polymorphus TaxID=672921 RepID=UPI003DA6770F